MKKIIIAMGLMLSFHAYSQTQSVQSTPIAVGADGLAGEAGEDEATMKARAELRASRLQKSETDSEPVEEGPELGDTSPLPPDGELLSGPTKNPVAETVDEPNKKSAPRDWQVQMGKRYFLIKSGLVSAQWKKVSPSLKNGSSVLGFGVYQKLHDQLGMSASLDFTHGFGGALVPEETRMFALHLKADATHPLNQKIQVLGSFGFQIADYQLRKKIGTTATTETYQTFGTGTAFGLQAGLGMRAVFSKDVFVDLSAGYLQYFSNPQKNFGGPLATLTMQLRL